MAKTPSITKGRKFVQVLEGARKVFLRDGFEGTSVDDVAREARVSKATLYSYFPDKRLMFAEVFRAELTREGEEARIQLDMTQPPEKLIPQVVRLIARHLVSDFGLRTYRVAVGESARFPKLAQEFYDTGPEQVRRRLVPFFRQCVAAGTLVMDDPELAADQLLELASANIHDRAVFLGASTVDDAAVRRTCEGAVRMFMACYGPRAQHPCSKAAE